MFTIVALSFIVLVGLIIGGVFASDKEYKESLTCFAIVVLAIICIADIFCFANETRDTLRTQAIEYGYAKYEVDSKGKITFAWIIPTPPPQPTKVEPVKPAAVTVEK
jgi:hypothetical protein